MSSAVRHNTLEVEKPVLATSRELHMAENDEKASSDGGEHGGLPKSSIDNVSDTDLTLASILKGSAHTRTTIFEKKAALVNA